MLQKQYNMWFFGGGAIRPQTRGHPVVHLTQSGHPAKAAVGMGARVPRTSFARRRTSSASIPAHVREAPYTSIIREEKKEAIADLVALGTRRGLIFSAGPEGIPAGQFGKRLGLAPATLSFHLSQLKHLNTRTL
jgi:hypothetical protein